MIHRVVIEQAGTQYGRLTVLGRAPNIVMGDMSAAAWYCLCLCGREIIARGTHLRGGSTRSCGCLNQDMTRERRRRHGNAVHGCRTREYKAWVGAKMRCFNPHSIGWKHYGGRGITMDVRWANDFAAFLDDMGPCPPECSLDRIDNNGPYAPGNCRWATRSEQERNKRPQGRKP